MEWYYYLIIAIAVLLLVFLITYLVSKNNKKKKNKTIRGYYSTIIEAVGGIENILEVSSNGSRLSLILKDNDKLSKDLLEKINITGIVRSSKKITLVIGEMASEYATSIEKEKNK